MKLFFFLRIEGFYSFTLKKKTLYLIIFYTYKNIYSYTFDSEEGKLINHI